MLKRCNIIFGSLLKLMAFAIAILIFSTALFKNEVKALPRRLSQIDFDLTKVFKLYSSPGRDTSIYFPCNVEYATGGTDEDIKITMPRKFPNLVTVFLTKGKSQSTSLKVFCSEYVFVFDVVPSLENHVDFLKITRIHGELPRYIDEKMGTRSNLGGQTIFSSKEIGGAK